MIKNYFTLDEDFEAIIKNALKGKDVTKMNQITTGWTNIVYEITADNKNYFLRFPRDDFWSRTIVKDYEFCKYIDGKTDFKTVKLELLYDNGRPFSIHEKVEGATLADKMNNMTPKQVENVSKDIAKFMAQLNNLDFDKNKIFKTNNIGLKLPDFLNELLDLHVDPKDKVFWKYEQTSKKDTSHLVHGDLNSSNIIIDDDGHISAVIDFGFAGFGNEYDDIARILSRETSEDFKQGIVKNYEEFSNKKLDYSVLNNEITTWKNIDGAYINYMTKIGIYKPE